MIKALVHHDDPGKKSTLSMKPTRDVMLKLDKQCTLKPRRRSVQ